MILLLLLLFSNDKSFGYYVLLLLMRIMMVLRFNWTTPTTTINLCIQTKMFYIRDFICIFLKFYYWLLHHQDSKNLCSIFFIVHYTQQMIIDQLSCSVNVRCIFVNIFTWDYQEGTCIFVLFCEVSYGGEQC